ncbi:MAG: PHP domain-containing protein [Clostridia bacterium]|nr:PHP domain-containing protein [Clostridia bacterium]
MKYIIDNDLHIHSKISSRSNDPEQTNERILRYAEENGLRTICLTDHFWDDSVVGASNWYKPQNYEHIAAAKPLPQAVNVQFLFGCETELDKNLTLGISKKNIDLFDFVIIPTTHLHMMGFTLTPEEDSVEKRAELWVKRFEAVLNMQLPFHKIGIAHLSTAGIEIKSRENQLKILNMLKTEDMERLFTKAANLGCGIELNSFDMDFADEETDSILRMYRIAKECGCKFYCGSDAHHPDELDRAKAIFERAIDLLELTEEDKFKIACI